jgi:hypothetical protein
MDMKPRLWVNDPPDLWEHDGRYCVRVHVKTDDFQGSLDLSPRTLRRLARNFDLAAELAEERERK